eukprot:NODE_4574_length_569_cov_268.925000_g3326_i0.p3 GENE.NODE_4574_length_569_cov_268.925000_g3326_i0~~NODE_4574_length_569_cov_268.925000_g3326_i0.p3  ORF type:complete len:160 (+),score=48.07 NODE_4574_length_569_cov_268.925000_g3326_i0:33-512(+)
MGTSYLLDSALVKLALHMPKKDTVRGITGTMPAKFVATYEAGEALRHGDAICDAAFMSTSLAVDVALGNTYGGTTLFVLRGRKPRDQFLRGGAAVGWVSQFPHEQEVLFPSYTELWYVRPEKRDKKQPWYTARRQQAVFEFTVRCYYDAARNCPYVPGV